MRRLCSLLVLPLLFIHASNAELYQWKDAQGRVHFSDQKPDTTDSRTLSLPDNGAMRSFEAHAAQPVPFSSPGTSRLLLIKPVQLALTPDATGNAAIGSYRFGPDCVSPTTITLQPWREQYPEADPLKSGYVDVALTELGRYGYNSMGWINSYPLQAGNIVLDIAITDLELLACARTLRANQRYDYASIAHAAARLAVQWTFRDASGRVIHQVSSEGVANLPEKRTQYMHDALTQAFRDALQHLLEDPAINRLMTPPVDTPADTAKPGNGMLGSAMQWPAELYDRYVQTAKLAEILALLSPLKTIVTEYQLENGEWPSSIDQLDLPAQSLSHPNRIARVSLRGEGEIVADISPVFGGGAHLSLIPSHTMAGMAVMWRCMSNIDSPTLQQWLLDTCGR